MDKIKDTLKQIGLTETEAEIYLMGLNYNSLGVSELEKKTRIKRTTIYHALNTLMAKGLAAKKGTESKYVFSMTNPDKIQGMIDREIKKLEEKNNDLKEIIPLLNKRIKQEEEPIKISHYEGIEGVKLVVEEALYCKSRQWKIIAPHKNFFSQFDKGYAKYFMKTRTFNKIQARTLWEGRFDEKMLSQKEIQQRNPRFLPKEMHGEFQSVIIIFDDKVAIISPLKDLSAILIQSTETNATFTAMFEGLWSVSKKYEDIVKLKN